MRTEVSQKDTKSDYGTSSGGSGFYERFGGPDPRGYQDNASGGLNYMSEKMFGQEMSEKSTKSFAQTKDFMTKRYLGTRESEPATSKRGRFREWLGGKKASESESVASGTSRKFYAADRSIADRSAWTKQDRSTEDGRALVGSSSVARETTRAPISREFIPAANALQNGRDEPDM
jgi:hypothetical protein